jgi:hypothetical protein
MAIDISYLIPELRAKIGDMNESSYRYLDSWLKTALVLAVKKLQKYQNYKYLVTSTDEVYRNPEASFLFPEGDYGAIQDDDEYIIVLAASIIVLEGSLENSAWDAVSWRDNEISFSNLERYRTKDGTLNRLIGEFNDILKPPKKRLAWVQKNSLPGYKPSGSQHYEHEGDY